MDLTNNQNIFWKCMWLNVIWRIWAHKNRVIFYRGKVNDEEVWYLAQMSAWVWLKSNKSGIFFHI